LGALHPRLLAFLRQLDHHDFRSGERIADRLGLSRASVHGLARQAADLGVMVQSVRGRGYRLAEPLHLLDEGRLATALAPAGFHVLCLAEADSTNLRLQQLAEAGAPHRTLLAAEWQSRGRGRRGREWRGVLGGSLTFSLLWRFRRPLSMLSGLSLAVGVALARAMTRLGAADLRLKWPNDLLRADAKLAGILIELSGDMLGPAAAVIGVGVNLRAADRLAAEVGQPVADLESALGRAVDRNELLAALATELGEVLPAFDQEGFAPFRRAWQELHAWQGQPVRVLEADGRELTGRARGVDEQGALLLDAGSGPLRVLSGEVSLRRASDARGAPA
jgi:BirA family biotin operon repressor/biotin-[acetyl-CoA-carboxylase] ligase